MHYFVFPKPVKMPAPPATGGEVEFGLHDLNREHVWGHDSWRASDDTFASLERCYEALADKMPGEIVEMRDDDWERYRPLATMQGAKLTGAQALPLSKLMRPVAAASTKRPDVPPAPPAPTD